LKKIKYKDGVEEERERKKESEEEIRIERESYY